MRRAPLRLNALTVAKMIRYLQEVPSNVYELAECCGLTPPTVRRFVLAMEKERAIRIVGWEKDSIGRYVTKVYAFGEGKNVPKPRPDVSINERRRMRAARKRQMGLQAALAGSSHRERETEGVR